MALHRQGAIAPCAELLQLSDKSGLARSACAFGGAKPGGSVRTAALTGPLRGIEPRRRFGDPRSSSERVGVLGAVPEQPSEEG